MEKKTQKKEDNKIEKVESSVVSMIEKEIKKEPVTYLSYSRAQLDQIKDIYAKGSSDIEFANFIVVASRTGLDIFKKQIYLIGRYDTRLGKTIFVPQTGIDGYRAVAERTGNYAGNDDATFKTDEKSKNPTEATVTVHKIVQGVRCPFTATARWDEYYPGDKLGFMWKQKPHVMLSKCAEALALRKAFPNVLGGIYTQEEMAIQDAQIKPITTDKVVNTMLEKAKVMIGKKTDVQALHKDLENIKASEKYNDKQKKEIEKVIENRIIELTPKNEQGK